MKIVPFFLVFIMVTYRIMSLSPVGAAQSAEPLLGMDRQCAIVAANHGALEALSRWLAPDGVVFPAFGHPLVGKTAFDHFRSNPDHQPGKEPAGWEPLSGAVSNDGTLGFTHGSYTLEKRTVHYGTVWQKQPDGHWAILASIGLIPFNDPGNIIPQPRATTDFASNTEGVVAAEYSFAAYARKHGIPASFYHFMASEGIALSAAGPPRHRDDYKDQISPHRLEWGPMASRIAGSGELACNYGPYIYTYTDKDQHSRSAYGYFCTIWQRQADGSWRFLFDGGNSCPKPSDTFLKEFIRHDR